jgi:hypothetical protein
MTDEIDWLGLGDAAEERAKTPGVMLPAAIGGHELRLMDRIHMDGAQEEYIGRVHKWCTKDGDGREHWHHDLSRAIFTSCTDPKTGEDMPEQWDTRPNPETRIDRSEGERWRKILGWPRGNIPTPDDAAAFMANGRARLRAKWWPELQKAREMDEAAARGEGERG